MAKRGGEGLARARALHLAAADDLIEVASAIPPERWGEPLADGKWSPAQVVDHLSRTYDVLLTELDGGQGMQVRTKPWMRILLRLVLVPRLLRGGAFPKDARAPRETRPADHPGEQGALIDRFRELAARLESGVEHAAREEPPRTLTHAYFGSSSIENGLLLCARHIQHHSRQLRAVGRP